MSEELQQKLRSQLWTVANTLRGNMSASDFMYFTLGFIFYKYLSEKIELYANEILEEDHITFKEVWNGKDEEEKEQMPFHKSIKKHVIAFVLFGLLSTILKWFTIS